MNDKDIIQHFTKIVDSDKNMSNGIAAIKTLLYVLEEDNCEFHENILIFHTKFYEYNFLITT